MSNLRLSDHAGTLRVVLFTRYTRLGASSRLRSLQFLPMLAAQGIAVDVHSLFDDEYLRALYGSRQRSMTRVLAAYCARWRAMRHARDYDLFWIEKELMPYLPTVVESAGLPHGIPTLVDYDDAVFHNYDRSASAFLRNLLGRKIDQVMAAATCVSVGNTYLAQRAHDAGARRVEIIPTVLDLSRYAPKSADVAPITDAASPPMVIGWIGSPATEHYLLLLVDTLRAVCAGGRARVVLVGANPNIVDSLPGVPVQVLPWSEASEAMQISRFDIGVMPLPDEPWERGKCGYKLIQYMACGLPVIASPVGCNSDIVNPGVTGLLATTTDEWRSAFSALADSAALRQRLGAAGRDRVQQVYSMQVQGERIAALLRSVASSYRGRA